MDHPISNPIHPIQSTQDHLIGWILIHIHPFCDVLHLALDDSASLVLFGLFIEVRETDVPRVHVPRELPKRSTGGVLGTELGRCDQKTLKMRKLLKLTPPCLIPTGQRGPQARGTHRPEGPTGKENEAKPKRNAKRSLRHPCATLRSFRNFFVSTLIGITTCEVRRAGPPQHDMATLSQQL